MIFYNLLNISRYMSRILVHLFILIFFTVVNLQAQDIDKDQKILELERKLNKVTEEVEKLKKQSLTEQKLTDIENKLNILAEEIENIKSSQVVTEHVYEEKHGRSAGASKVYLTDNGVSIGGYGELLIGQIRQDDDNTIDAQRAVFYFGYKFTDNIIFNSEIEFEHATTSSNLDDRDGSVSVEFAAIDFLIRDEFNIRAGLLLAPFGIINEFHEPTTFFGVLRPDVERIIIPTTWRENGAGIFGETDRLLPGILAYRLYIMNSFDSRGFEASNNRDIRTKGNRSRFNDVAFVGRIEYEPIPYIKLGGSVFIGDTGQNEKVDGQNIDGLFQMYEADIQLQYRGLGVKGLFVYTFLNDADLININNDLVGEDSVGEEQYGWYIETSYNILASVDIHPYFQYLAPFIRYEKYNTQREVPKGFISNPENDRSLVTLGISYKPIEYIVLKFDYQFRHNEANTAVDQFNLGLGYIF